MNRVTQRLPWRRQTTLRPVSTGPDLARKIGYLSSIEIFSALPEERLEAIQEATTMFTCARGAVIYEPGETGEVLFLLKRGLVQLYNLSPDGKKLVVGSLGPGAFFGDMPLLGQNMYGTFAEASRECLICAMGQEDVEALLLSEPQVALSIVHVLGRQLTEQRTVLAEMVFKSVPGRAAALLLRLAAETHKDTITGLSHQDLADRAGMARETMTQTLNEFAHLGAVELQRMTVILRDRELLQALAER